MSEPKLGSLRPAVLGDEEAVAELRATVLRDDLVRLERYDEVNTRQRRRNAFVVDHTSIVLTDEELVGSGAIRPAAGQPLYARHGSVVVRQDHVDVFMVRRHETVLPPSLRDR